MCEDDITNVFLRWEDSEKLRRMLLQRKETAKITWVQTLYKRLRDGVAKLKVDNAKALAYIVDHQKIKKETSRSQSAVTAEVYLA
jgi:hypothetical protein